jgi:hypothetical protein
MPDVDEGGPLWLRWFLNAENTDAAAIRTALRVVPEAFWPSVHWSISSGLSGLSTKTEGGAGDVLEMKRALLRQEDQRRTSL